MMKPWLPICIMVAAFCTGCRTTPEDWWNYPSWSTPSNLYFVGVSPPHEPQHIARTLAEAHGRRRFVEYYKTTIKIELSTESSNQGTQYEDRVQAKAEELVEKMMAINYHTDKKKGITYVLMEIKNPDPNLHPIKKQITDWWKWEESLNSKRVYASLRGWNFWYLNDEGYVYADPLSAGILESANNNEGENQFNQFFPMITGLGGRLPLSGIVIVGAEISTAQVSAGIGLSIPFYSITPWVIGGLGWTNVQPNLVPVVEGGLDFTFTCWERIVLIGINLSYVQDTLDSSPHWQTLGYGLSAGMKW